MLETELDTYKNEVTTSIDEVTTSIDEVANLVSENAINISALESNIATNYALKSDIPTSAEDVGALASSYGSIIDDLSKRWGKETQVNACDNCDNPMYTGLYHCSTSTTGTKPSEYGELFHITENILYSEHQLFFPAGGSIYHRHRNNGGTANSATWSAWTKII